MGENRFCESNVEWTVNSVPTRTALGRSLRPVGYYETIPPYSWRYPCGYRPTEGFKAVEVNPWSPVRNRVGDTAWNHTERHFPEAGWSRIPSPSNMKPTHDSDLTDMLCDSQTWSTHWLTSRESAEDRENPWLEPTWGLRELRQKYHGFPSAEKVLVAHQGGVSQCYDF